MRLVRRCSVRQLSVSRASVIAGAAGFAPRSPPSARRWRLNSMAPAADMRTRPGMSLRYRRERLRGSQTPAATASSGNNPLAESPSKMNCMASAASSTPETRAITFTAGLVQKRHQALRQQHRHEGREDDQHDGAEHDPHIHRPVRLAHQQHDRGQAARSRGQWNGEREHRDVGLLGLRLARLGRGDGGDRRMLRQQEVRRHHQQKYPARGAECRQTHADQVQQLNPAQRERQKHAQRHQRRQDRDVPLARRRPVRP